LIDLHSHVAWGYDDGAADAGESLAMARLYAEQGVATVAATPHVTIGWATPPLDQPERCASLTAEWRAEGIEIDLVPAAEIYLVGDTAERLADRREGHRPLGQSRYVLVEFNLANSPGEAVRPLGDLLDGGWRPVLAHPERYRYFWQHPAALADLAAMGVLLQVTAGSLLGEFGAAARRLGERLVRAELTALVATDAHHFWRRRPNLVEGRARLVELVGPEAADRLTRRNPEAVLADGDVTVTGDPDHLREDEGQQSFLGALLR
jgi:protein-tyrosine phosphatase